jgi:RNA polymerase sigma-70 factor (ECF subfamily)
MDDKKWLAERFEAHRAHLRGVAYRMLGSLSEAEDAVQESWLRLSRSDTSGVENLGGWLTTIVARVSLDMLRSRKSRREEPMDAEVSERVAGPEAGTDPEHEAILADSVGLALLVVLGKLEPAERVAFVLHDMFGLPFDEIARVVERTPSAARQLASRARRRVHGADMSSGADLVGQRAIVDAFLAASRAGDFNALLAVLDPDVVFRADRTAVRMGGKAEIRGATAVANTFKGRARAAQPALVDGSWGLIVAPQGKLRIVLGITITANKIAAIEAIADPERLRQLDLAILKS